MNETKIQFFVKVGDEEPILLETQVIADPFVVFQPEVEVVTEEDTQAPSSLIYSEPQETIRSSCYDFSDSIAV